MRMQPQWVQQVHCLLWTTQVLNISLQNKSKLADHLYKNITATKSKMAACDTKTSSNHDARKPHNWCVPTTEIFGKISVASARTHCPGEEMLLSSGWALIGSELSSPTVNSSVTTERSFAIRYLNVVIKPLCGNLESCLNYCFRSRDSVCLLSVATERCFFGSRYSVALLRTLADFATEIYSVVKNPSTRMHLLWGRRFGHWGIHISQILGHQQDNTGKTVIVIFDIP